MIPYTVRLHSEEDTRLLFEIRRVVEALPDIDLGLYSWKKPAFLTSHMLVRALAAVFPVEFRDGHFGAGTVDVIKWAHSWLVTGQGNIIDAYPISHIGGPFLVDGRPIAPWHELYREGLLDGVYTEDLAQRTVTVTQVIRQIIATLGDFKFLRT